ncbi:UNVERIFIED_CONTAM: hypothetical protein FKN15_021894 [Acipenser sinensis]
MQNLNLVSWAPISTFSFPSSVGKHILTESGSIKEPHSLATKAFHAKGSNDL